MEQLTIPRMVFGRVARQGDRLAVRHRRGGVFHDLSWNQYGEAIADVARGLEALGLEEGQRTAILSNTRIEWHFADLGTQSLAGIAVGIYPTLLAEEVGFILRDCGAKVVFCEDWTQYEKVVQVRAQCPELLQIVLLDPEGVQLGADVLSLDQLRAKGAQLREADPGGFGDLLKRGKPDDLFTIIYTSGTTGRPKGAMISHNNALSVCRAIEELNIISERDVSIEYLPLAHAYERIGGMLLGLYAGGVTAIAESFETLRDDIITVQPTVMVGVPRVFEKIYDSIRNSVEQSGTARRKLFEWALSVGREALPYRLKRLPLPYQLKLRYALADKLVFTRLAQKLGGRLRFALSAAAPLSQEIIEFYFSLGVTLLQGFGMTECSAPAAITTPEDPAIGTVGKPLSCNEIKLADDSEVLIRGANVFKGYWNNPKDTAEALDDKGWLHTGDIGVIDADGNLIITDRKKHLIITAGGKNIAPVAIENALKSEPYITEALAYGDRRPYLVALLTVDEERIQSFAHEQQIQADDFATLLNNPSIKVLIDHCVEKANLTLPRFEQIKRFHILPGQFSIEDGTLTPTLKLKRRKIIERYSELIDEMYN
ncbi:MAG: long-chain fatty acid--CoA ligase [Candidatus Alcyoniella australis]|nr:long-chain fatty acid--CoA ligase [Candidatus Alcyoniella australis]